MAAFIASAFFTVAIHSLGYPPYRDGNNRLKNASLMNRMFSLGRKTDRSPPVCARPRNNTWISVPPRFRTFLSDTTSVGNGILEPLGPAAALRCSRAAFD